MEQESASGRRRLVRDARRSVRSREVSAVERFKLAPGEMYRIAYAVGGGSQRRVTRSVAVFRGLTEHRRWTGDIAPCLDFALPRGRALSLVFDQLVDARPATQNDRGQWVLQDPTPRRRRGVRGPSYVPAAGT